MLAISLGYPLGADNKSFLVQYNKKIHRLSFEEAAVWMGFNGIKHIEALNNDVYIFEELVRRGLIVKAASEYELFTKIQSSIPLRQGAGSIVDGKMAIFLGETVTAPTHTQYMLWLQCNGSNTVYDIFSYLGRALNSNLSELLTAFNCFDEKDLVDVV